jgi:PAS domain S-box
MGIYFIPREQFSRLEELKIILEMGIVILTVGLIFWIFLIEPNLSNQEDFFPSIISITYIIGDFVLLFALLRLLYSRFKEEYYGPMILLGLGIIVTIVSDCIYSYQNLLGTYISGGLLDAGWMIGLLLFGLSAFLHASNEKYDIYPYFKSLPLARSNLTSYLPLIWALIAFILLIHIDMILYQPNISLIEIIVGIIIFMVLIRQLLTEKALTLSEKNYRELVDNSLVGIYKTHLNGDIIFANESLARIFKSKSVEELKSKKIIDFYKNHSERKEIIHRLKKEGKLEQYELEMVSTTGETVNMLLSANLTGNIISGMLMDITQRKFTETALKDNEEKYRTLFEANPNHTILVSSDGVILDANSSAVRFSGLSTDELVGKNFSDLGIFSEENLSFVREKFSLALEGETLKPFQYRLINKKGKYSWIETQLVPIKKGWGDKFHSDNRHRYN